MTLSSQVGALVSFLSTMSTAASSTAAAAAASAPQWSLLQRTYRKLRVAGERPSFLRHCTSVYTPEQCGTNATRLLQAHRRLAALRAERAQLPVWRLLRRTSLSWRQRAERVRLYRVRGMLQLGNVVSDFFVVVTMACLLWVAGGSFNIIRVALERHRMLDEMAGMLFSTVEALENTGAANTEAAASGTAGQPGAGPSSSAA